MADATKGNRGAGEAGRTESIAVIGDSALCTGFALAGVQRLHPTVGVAEAEAALNRLMDDASVGIVVVEETLLEQADFRLKRRVEAAAKPVVVTVPGRAGPAEQTESLGKLVKRALGFDIMKGGKK